jgi:hypothetical protein
VTAPEKLYIEGMLVRIAEELQLSDTQYQRAKSEYESVGDWLDRPQSPFHGRQPLIYPQGSMALQTTVRPKDHFEYDLDLVMRLDNWTGTIADYHATLKSELQKYAAQATTQDVKVSSKSRCVRLEYTKSFHLDVVPSREKAHPSTTAIEVPDKTITRWLFNNPLKYQQWFEEKCKVRRMVMAEARQQAPLPPNSSAREKAPLKSAVQLLKRRRDRWYASANQPDEAPPSIVVTTFAAEHYDGVDNVADTLDTISNQLVKACSSWQPKLFNPAVEGEDFLQGWSPAKLKLMHQFATQLTWELGELTKGGPNAQKLLEDMFGEPVKAAFLKLAEDSKRQADSGGLRVSSAGYLGVAGAAVKPHTFFGK